MHTREARVVRIPEQGVLQRPRGGGALIQEERLENGVFALDASDFPADRRRTSDASCCESAAATQRRGLLHESAPQLAASAAQLAASAVQLAASAAHDLSRSFRRPPPPSFRKNAPKTWLSRAEGRIFLQKSAPSSPPRSCQASFTPQKCLRAARSIQPGATLVLMNTSRGHIASRKALLAFGMTHHSIARAVARGELLRLRRGWYATPLTSPSAMRAVTVGGVTTSLSATELLGLWTPPDSALHVAVPSNASRLRAAAPDPRRPQSRPQSTPQSTSRSTALPASTSRSHTGAASRGESAPTPLCLHWRNHRSSPRDGVASVIDALIDAVQCQPEEYAVVVIDSALNRGLVTLRQLEAAFEQLPRRYARALGRADGRSQSGTETLVRLRLRALGIRVSLQVRISGVGYVDLIVGDRFVLECDSRRFHTGDERYHGDRLRDRELIKLGYLPMRLTYEMIMFDWPETLETILSRVRRREHLWPRRSKTGKTAARRTKTHDEDGSS